MSSARVARCLAVLVPVVAGPLCGCQAPPAPEPGRTVATTLPLLVASGEVVGPLGLHRDDAQVRLWRLDPSTGREVLVAEAQNSLVEGFRVTSGYLGPHRLEVLAADCLPAVRAVDVTSERVRIDGTVRLEPEGVVALSGVVRDASSSALSADDGAFLAALPLVAAAWHDGDGLRIHEVRAPLDERGAFSFQVPIGFAGVVELRCAESLIADAPWRPGDGLVSFSVDVAALRAHAGAIDVLADRRVDVTVHRVGDALRFPGLEPLADVEAASGRVTLDALWPGTYLVVATPEGSAPSVRRVNVSPGSTVSVPVEPRAPVARRVHVFGLAPDDVSPFLDEVTAATREGAPLPVRISPGAAPGALEVFGPPGGEVVLRARGHALRVMFGATSGERDGVVEWDVGPTYRAWIPVALARFLGSPRPETVAVRVRLETWDDVVQDEWWADVALDAQGNGLAPVPFVPGRYVLRVDVPAAESWTIEDAVLHPTDHDRVLLFGDGDWR